jgi:hypothetical protein
MYTRHSISIAYGRRLPRLDEKSISAALFRRKQAQLQSEIDAARQSLAETDLRLTIDHAQLSMALELVEDVQAAYRVADEQTRRGFNQAFFKKLYVMPEWDEEPTEPSARR